MSQGMLGNLALSDVFGPRNDLEAKLAGPDGATWLMALKRLLRKENPWAEIPVVPPAPVVPSPSPWKTVMLGLRKTAEAYAASFASKKYEAGTWATQIMAKIRYAQKPRAVELFLVLDSDLGLTNGYVIADVFKAARTKGYKKCPPEVGPALRDQYDDQPVGEYVYVLMEPVLDSDSNLRGFDVYRSSDGTYLLSSDANPERQFRLGTRWVVWRPAASV